MSKITHVCLSDLHLGEEDSILSNMNADGTEGDPRKAGPVLEQLVLCLKDLRDQMWKGEKPVLVLNGDILELALCPMHKAAMAFQCFIKLLKDGRDFMFSRIICLPGNHDHHLWVMTREDQYRDYLCRNWLRPSLIELPAQWHSTKMFAPSTDPPVMSHYLTDLIRRPPVFLGTEVEVRYPNFGLIDKPDLKPDKVPAKCVIFHHGQFTEWIYTAMSRVNDWIFLPENQARHVWGLEKENFAWIDFAWSALGQAWESGYGLEPVYEKALDERQFGEVLANLSLGLLKEMGSKHFAKGEAFILGRFLRLLYHHFAGTEKGQTEEVLSDGGRTELRRYLEGPLHAQIGYDITAWKKGVNELDESVYTPDYFSDMTAPKTTFIFGHTHKPFVCHESFKGFPGKVEVFNSGGWVVETLDPGTYHGGSIVLVDNHLNVAAIRMYNEQGAGAVLPVAPDSPQPRTRTLNPLERAVHGLNFSNAPWTTFSKMVAVTVPMRRKYLRKRVFGSIPKPR